MDKLAHYREQIKHILTQYAEILSRQPTPGIDTELVFDETHDHYMLMNIGWWPQGRVRGATVYVRLHNGKCWIEEDWLENGIVAELLERGIPKEDIVLGFQPPEMRPLTDFAVA